MAVSLPWTDCSHHSVLQISCKKMLAFVHSNMYSNTSAHADKCTPLLDTQNNSGSSHTTYYKLWLFYSLFYLQHPFLIEAFITRPINHVILDIMSLWGNTCKSFLLKRERDIELERNWTIGNIAAKPICEKKVRSHSLEDKIFGNSSYLPTLSTKQIDLDFLVLQ